MKSVTTKWYSIITGSVFLLLILIVLILIPCPSNSLLNFFRIFIAISAAAFAATIPGTMKVNNKLVTASSSLGVFVLIYLVNPAGWSSTGDCNVKHLKATVYIDDNLAKDVQLIIPDIRQNFLTDEFGNINIEYTESQISFPTKLIFKYKSKLDTTVVIQKSFDQRMEFHFATKKSGVATFFENSVSYNFQDLDLNISLINANNFDEYSDATDTVFYKFKNSEDTIYITPSFKVLNQIYNSEIVEELGQFGDLSLEINLPQLDFKFTNNSSDAIFLNEINLSIDKSEKNNEALLIPSGFMPSFFNAGWGDARDVMVNYSVIPNVNNELNWNNLENGIDVGEVKSGAGFDMKEGVDHLLIMRGVNPEIFEDDKKDMVDLYDPKNIEQRRYYLKEYTKGAIIYGVITYSDAVSNNQKERFRVSYDVYFDGLGSGEVELSKTYNTHLRAEGTNYQVPISISQGINPKDFDRFSLVIASPQSSFHYFHLSFFYNNKKIELPYIFKLQYFNTVARQRELHLNPR